MKTQIDVAILGAGLAGLSLAVRLCKLPRPPSILLIDPRLDYLRDRTWCHWAAAPHPFLDCISHRWPRWTVRNGNQSITRESAEFPYVRIPADALYTQARELLALAPEVEWALGQTAEHLRETDAGVEIDLSGGTRVTTGKIYDSRPLESAATGGWRQIFRGLELRSSQTQLSTDEVTLMDFQSAGRAGIRFFYALPLSANTILVEDTRLCPPRGTVEFSDEAIIDYASEHFGGGPWEVIHREEGVIPMRVMKTPAQVGSNISIGTRGGAVRASSGYAFSRIQEQSARLAGAYPNGSANIFAGSTVDRLDEIFLRVLDRDPGQLPELMMQLFQKTPTPSLVRFMESRASWKDNLTVVRALPCWPFLRAVLFPQ